MFLASRVFGQQQEIDTLLGFTDAYFELDESEKADIFFKLQEDTWMDEVDNGNIVITKISYFPTLEDDLIIFRFFTEKSPKINRNDDVYLQPHFEFAIFKEDLDDIIEAFERYYEWERIAIDNNVTNIRRRITSIDTHFFITSSSTEPIVYKPRFGDDISINFYFICKDSVMQKEYFIQMSSVLMESISDRNIRFTMPNVYLDKSFITYFLDETIYKINNASEEYRETQDLFQ